MFQGESLCKNFIRGLAFLDSYIKLNNKTHLQDINIISEQFCGQLLNTLYGWELLNANADAAQMPGYDLISIKDQIIIQVTSQCKKTKVQDCFEKLEILAQRRDEVLRKIQQMEQKTDQHRMDEEKLIRLRAELAKLPDLTGYELRFLFLTTDASDVRKGVERMAQKPAVVRFDPSLGIMDFKTLASSVQKQCMCTEQREKLDWFIRSHADLFIQNIPPRDHVREIIDEYAQNFQSELFMHRDRNNMVTLQNLYVEPSYQYVDRFYTQSRDIPGLLCDFLWQRPENDDERMLIIEGDAAIGKTSLVSWLCYHYNLITGGVEDTVGAAVFLNRKVVCIRLRELDFTRGSSAKEAVLRYLNVDNMKQFKQRYHRAILILDGADELSMVSGSQIQSIESFLQDLQWAFQDHKFIITTRPKFLDLNSTLFHQSTFGIRRVELLHYNRGMRQQWLENYKRCGETINPETEEYIASLSDELAEGVADTPLALYLLVKCRIRDELRGNSWALYREIFSSAITDGRYNQNFEESSVLMSPLKAQTNYRVVQNIAYRMFQNAKEDRYYLNTDEIDEVIRASELNGLTKEQVRSTCVLCAYWKNTTTLGALEFYHNNIRDFFLCEYIAEVLIRCIRSRKEEEMFQALTAEFCRIFCWGNISGTTWEQAFTFLRLRLLFEKDHHIPNSLYSYLRRVKNLPNIVWHLFVSRELWSNPSLDVPYVAAKQAIGNAMMLVRILMDMEPEWIVHCSNEKQRKAWFGSGLLQDWRELLSQSVQQTGVASKTVWQDLNWGECSLENVDFRESRLLGISFDGTNLKKCDFRNAMLQACRFQGTRFSKVNFDGSMLDQITFDETDLSGIAFGGTIIDKCEMQKVRIGNNRFVECKIDNLVLESPKSENIRFHSVQFSGCRLANCVFGHSSFIAMRIENSEWRDVDCTGGIISGFISDSRFDQFRFGGGQFLCNSSVSSEFTESIFDHVKWAGELSNARFIGCSFNDCDFSGINRFQNVVFEDCKFHGAIFRKLLLQVVTFQNAILCEAVFEDTILIQCKVVGSNLQGANFKSARNMDSVFSNVDFTGASFYGSKGFEQYIPPAL